MVWTAVRNEVAARAAGEILGEIGRLRDEPVTAEELDEGIRYLRGVFPYGLQSHGGLLGRIEDLAVFDLPDDYFDRFLAEVGAIGVERLERVARQHLHPEDATLVAVGPAAELERGLERFGPVEVARAVPAAA
jgi:predicted Zn-dependent peptidase